MQKQFLTPNATQVIGESDSISIQNAVDEASRSGINCVLIPRFNERTSEPIWNIEKTILLPSNMTILLDNCHLRLADGVFENIFRNSYMYTEFGNTLEGVQRNIIIEGIGTPLLDGGLPNGLTETTSDKNGYPNIYFNHLIELHNVQNAAVEKIAFTNPRHWAVNLSFCKFVRLSQLHFDTDSTLPNRDGIDIREGCSHITIENITGQTGDDVIAVTVIPWNESITVKDACPNSHDILIRNVHATTKQAIVALRNNDGAKLYNISVENIFDTGSGGGFDNPYTCVRVGENFYFKKRLSTLGETYGITVRNVYANCNRALTIGATLKNCSFSGIYCNGTVDYAVTTFVEGQHYGGVTMENCNFDNICINNNREKGAALYFPLMRETDTVKNVVFTNVYDGGTEKNNVLCGAAGNIVIN